MKLVHTCKHYFFYFSQSERGFVCLNPTNPPWLWVWPHRLTKPAEMWSTMVNTSSRAKKCTKKHLWRFERERNSPKYTAVLAILSQEYWCEGMEATPTKHGLQLGITIIIAHTCASCNIMAKCGASMTHASCAPWINMAQYSTTHCTKLITSYFVYFLFCYFVCG